MGVQFQDLSTDVRNCLEKFLMLLAQTVPVPPKPQPSASVSVTEMKKFPEAWLIRLREVVNAVRRQEGFRDVFASVEPPQKAGSPPILRLEMAGQVEVVSLTLRSVQHMIVTGQQGPLLTEIKQAFMSLIKLVDRRARLGRLRAQHRKSYL
jgi:hypothetical protein